MPSQSRANIGRIRFTPLDTKDGCSELDRERVAARQAGAELAKEQKARAAEAEAHRIALAAAQQTLQQEKSSHRDAAAAGAFRARTGTASREPGSNDRRAAAARGAPWGGRWEATDSARQEVPLTDRHREAAASWGRSRPRARSRSTDKASPATAAGLRQLPHQTTNKHEATPSTRVGRHNVLTV